MRSCAIAFLKKRNMIREYLSSFFGSELALQTYMHFEGLFVYRFHLCIMIIKIKPLNYYFSELIFKRKWALLVIFCLNLVIMYHTKQPENWLRTSVQIFKLQMLQPSFVHTVNLLKVTCICMYHITNVYHSDLVQRSIEINMSTSLYLYGKVHCMPDMLIIYQKLVFFDIKNIYTRIFCPNLVSHSSLNNLAKDLCCCKLPPFYMLLCGSSRSSSSCDDLTCN